MEVAVNDEVEPALMTVRELTKYLSMCEKNVRKLLSEPNCCFRIKIGGTIFAHKKKLDKWLEQQAGR